MRERKYRVSCPPKSTAGTYSNSEDIQQALSVICVATILWAANMKEEITGYSEPVKDCLEVDLTNVFQRRIKATCTFPDMIK